MRSFKWSKSNAVYLAPIDDEHRTIFEATGELQQALQRRAPLFQVQEILHRLIACTEDHFAHEEKLMRATRYLSFDWHKGQHDTARKRLREYVPLIEVGDVDAGTALVNFLTRWLDDHTAVTDRMMGAYLRNQDRERIA
jgi:hemerythrin-like metal-binding protein